MRSSSRLRSLISGLAPRPRTSQARRSRRTLLQVSSLEEKVLMAAGALDPTFGTGGRLISDAVAGKALAAQSDGKVVVAGWVYDQTGLGDVQVTRLNPDGTLDPSFGVGGRATVDFSPYDGRASAVTLQPDGKIVVAGNATGDGGSATPGFMVTRLNPDGSLDTAFGAGGKATVIVSTAPAYDGEWVNAVVAQPDGKILLGGVATALVGNSTSQDFALARFNADGTRDATFGAGGKIITTFNPTQQDWLHALALQPDGKIVAAGEAVNAANGSDDFALARYNVDGSLDTTFDGDGMVTTNFNSAQGKPNQPLTSSIDLAKALAVQPDGKIVVAGETNWSKAKTGVDFALARYNANGSLDAAFGSGGKVITDFGTPYDGASSIALQTVGGQLKIVVGGYAGVSGNSDFALARYNANGSLDATFGSGGKVITAFGPFDDGSYGLVIQPDGKILALGYTYNGKRSSLAVARYLGV